MPLIALITRLKKKTILYSCTQAKVKADAIQFLVLIVVGNASANFNTVARIALDGETAELVDIAADFLWRGEELGIVAARANERVKLRNNILEVGSAGSAADSAAVDLAGVDILGYKNPECWQIDNIAKFKNIINKSAVKYLKNRPAIYRPGN